jgi:uncharacterized membrane protein
MLNYEPILLYIHIAAGFIGLFIGPVAMFAKKRKGLHTNIGTTYHWLVFTVCLTGLPLSILHWERNWHLFFIAFFSYSFAYKGYRAAKKRYQGWLKSHITGMLASYIAMSTALLVVNASNIPLLNQAPRIVVWLLPTLIGSPLIAMVQKKMKNPQSAQVQ